MIKLVFGDQKMLINKMVEKIVKEHLSEVNEFNYVVYDALKTPLFEIVNEAETVSFFDEKKVIILNNAYFLTGENPSLDFEQNFSEFENYMDNEIENVILIITVEKEKLHERKNIVKKLI